MLPKSSSAPGGRLCVVSFRSMPSVSSTAPPPTWIWQHGCRMIPNPPLFKFSQVPSCDSLRDGCDFASRSYSDGGLLTGVCDRTVERKHGMLVGEIAIRKSESCRFAWRNRMSTSEESNVRRTFAGTSELEGEKKCQHFWSKGGDGGRSQLPLAGK